MQERLGGGVVVLRGVKRGDAGQGGRHDGVVGAEHPFADRQGRLLELERAGQVALATRRCRFASWRQLRSSCGAVALARGLGPGARIVAAAFLEALAPAWSPLPTSSARRGEAAARTSETSRVRLLAAPQADASAEWRGQRAR